MAIGKAGGWRLKTFAEFLRNYAAHRSPEWLDASGMPCGPNSRGVIQRMPIRDGERWLRTKESLTWSDDPAHAFETRGPAESCLDDHIGDNREAFWREILVPAIRTLGAGRVAPRNGDRSCIIDISHVTTISRDATELVCHATLTASDATMVGVTIFIHDNSLGLPIFQMEPDAKRFGTHTVDSAIRNRRRQADGICEGSRFCPWRSGETCRDRSHRRRR